MCLFIVTSAKEVVFLPLFVCSLVCVSCQLDHYKIIIEVLEKFLQPASLRTRCDRLDFCVDQGLNLIIVFTFV